MKIEGNGRAGDRFWMVYVFFRKVVFDFDIDILDYKAKPVQCSIEDVTKVSGKRKRRSHTGGTFLIPIAAGRNRLL
jgi:hypothetical protein